MKKHFSKPELSRKINGDIPSEKEEVSEEETGKVRVDQLLFLRYPDYSRTAIRKLILSGKLRVNGEVVKDYSEEVWPEDEIELALPEMEAVPPVDEMRIFENENVIVVDKPVGFLSMRKASLLTEPALEDYGFLVHRLDRLTSGVVIIAKNEKAQSFLQKQFQQRKVHKTYFAIVEGRMKIPEAEISVPIKRNLARPTTFKVSADGREAETYYRVVAESEKYSLVELKPRTGRTHQLRIHMKYVGNPIVGDPIYGEAGEMRMMLHARELEITVPTGGDLAEGAEGIVNERMTFRAEVPAEFREFMRKNGLEYEF